jgi:saccharopine dehydrogenase (NAD+, L-lysine-forming)
VLEWPKGGRILGFGKWAGIVGAYNAFLTWGKKTDNFTLPAAYETDNFEQSMADLIQIKQKMGNPRIVYTGNGRVANGIREVLETMKITEVTPHDFVMKRFKEPVFTHLTNWDLYHRKDGGKWSDEHFYANHDAYCCEFDQYFEKTDILINGMYWEDDMPALFSKEDTTKSNFNLKVIADITCDVEGSVPITMEATDIYNPTFGWSKSQQKQVAAYGEDTIDVMAVTNLPTEMPKNASAEFGGLLLENIIPLLINGDKDDILKRANITNNGQLTEVFDYLQDFVDGK